MKRFLNFAAVIALFTAQLASAQTKQTVLVKPTRGEMKSTDRKYNNRHYFYRTYEMTKGVTYHVEMFSQSFDTMSTLYSPKGQVVAQSIYPSKSTKRFSRLIYTATVTGKYHILLSTAEAGKTGKYLYQIVKSEKVVKDKPVVDVVVGRVHAKAKETVAALQREAKNAGGSIALSKIRAFAGTAFSMINIQAPTFGVDGTCMGDTNFGGKNAKVLLQYLPPEGVGLGKWALAIQMPSSRGLSDVLNLPGFMKTAIDQFDSRAPIFVFSPESTDLESGDLSKPAKAFFGKLYKSEDFTVRIKKGVNLLTAASFRTGSAADNALKRFGINVREVQLEGVVLKDFDFNALKQAKANGKLLKALGRGTSLRATLPHFKLSKLPRGWLAGSAFIEVTGQPSVALGCTLKVPHGGNVKTFTAKLKLSKTSGGAEASIVAISEGRWHNALGLNGFHLDRVALVLGLDTKLNLTFGMQAKFEVARKKVDLAGKFKVNLTTGAPTDIIFRVGSKDDPLSLGTHEVVALANQMIKTVKRNAKPISTRGMPNIEIRDFYLSYAPQGGDEDLQIEDGIGFSGSLYYNGKRLAFVKGHTNFAAAFPTLELKGAIANIDLRGLKLKDASVDIKLAASLDSYFKVKGSLTVLGLTNSVDVNISRTHVHFKVMQKLQGVYKTEYSMYSASQGNPFWRFQAKVQNDLTQTLERDVANAIASFRQGANRKFNDAKRKLDQEQAKVNGLQRDLNRARARAKAQYDAYKNKLAKAQQDVRNANNKLDPVRKERDNAKRNYDYYSARTTIRKRIFGKTITVPNPDPRPAAQAAVWGTRWRAAQASYEAAKGVLTTANRALSAVSSTSDWTVNAVSHEAHPDVVRIKGMMATATLALQAAQRFLSGVQATTNGATQIAEWTARNSGQVFSVRSISFTGSLGTTVSSIGRSAVSLNVQYRFLGQTKSLNLRLQLSQVTPRGLVSHIKSALKIN